MPITDTKPRTQYPRENYEVGIAASLLPKHTRTRTRAMSNSQAPTEPTLQRSSLLQDQRRVRLSFSSCAARRSGQGLGS
jgi:hypothetical protein